MSLRGVRARHLLAVLVWFDHDKETDWRIDSSTASARAFAAGLAGWLG